jgi:hypothetical protein
MKYIILALCLLLSSCATTSLSESCECKCDKCVEFCSAKDGDPICRKLLRLKCSCK